MAYIRCSECGEYVVAGPGIGSDVDDGDFNTALFRRFQRHCIVRSHLLGDGDCSWLIAFADYRLAAIPPQITYGADGEGVPSTDRPSLKK